MAGLITGKDARYELKCAKENTTKELHPIIKLLGVIIKLLISIRRNNVKIMNHLNIPLDEPLTKEKIEEIK